MNPEGEALRTEEDPRLLWGVSVGLVLVVLLDFLGPAMVLGVPDGLRNPVQTVFDAVSLALLVFLLLTAVGIADAFLRHRRPWRSGERLLGVMAVVLAAAHVLQLLLGVAWPGPSAALLQAVWFAVPLALGGAAILPRFRRVDAWWKGPFRAMAVGFPIIFLLAGLGRVDFRLLVGATLPLPLGWVLAYGPTVAVILLALLGWAAFEARSDAAPASRALDAAAVVSGAAAVGVLVTARSSVGFVLSATVTWGSGYQLFPAPFSPSPLAPAFVLLTLAFVAFLVVLVRQWRQGRPALPLLLALAVVLAGVFPTPNGALGSLVVLMVLGFTLTSDRAG